MGTPRPNEHTYGPENVVAHTNGNEIRVPAHPDLDYVRVCDSSGKEIAYWVMDELADDPSDVLGAIIGATIGSSN